MSSLSGGLHLVELEVGGIMTPDHQKELKAAVKAMAVAMTRANKSLALWAFDLKSGLATSDVVQDVEWPEIDNPDDDNALGSSGALQSRYRVVG